MNVEEAISDLEEEIKEKQEEIALLTRFSELATKTMTEAQYHIFCDTGMRSSDQLGQALVSVFPFLIYDHRQANAFVFQLEATKVLIPNSRKLGIEIVLPKVYREPQEESKPLETRKKIEMLRGYFTANDNEQKAQYIFPRYYRPWVATLLYVLKNPFLHYSEQIQRQIERLEEREQREQRLWQEKRTEQIQGYREQTQFFEKYLPLFFSWTKEVRIYEAGWACTRIRYLQKDGHICQV